MNAIIPEVLDGLNSVLEKVIQAQVGLPAGVSDPVLVKLEGSIESMFTHADSAPAVSAVRGSDGSVTAIQKGS